MRTVEIGPTFEAWQAVARALLHEGVPPAEVTWRHAPAGPAGATGAAAVATQAAAGPRVPRQFIELARQAAGSSDPERWALLYEILWRLVHERRDLLADSSDPQVRRLNALAAPLRLESPSSGADRRGTGRRRVRSRRTPRSTSSARPARAARAAISSATPPRRSSAAVRPLRASCWSASSPATRKIARARRSSVRPARCSTARWSRSDSTASTCTSPTP